MDQLISSIKSLMRISETPLASIDEPNSDFDNHKPSITLIEIQYCGACGFASRFELAKDLILEEFNRDPRIEVIGVVDKDTTGNFEIRIDGELVHSKATKKHGFLHNNATQQVIVLDAIRAKLDALTS